MLAAFERLLSKVPKGFEDFYDEEEKKSGPKKVYSVKRKGARGNKEGADVEPEKPGFGMGGDGDKKRSGGRNNRKKKPEGEEYSISLVVVFNSIPLTNLFLVTDSMHRQPARLHTLSRASSATYHSPTMPYKYAGSGRCQRNYLFAVENLVIR